MVPASVPHSAVSSIEMTAYIVTVGLKSIFVSALQTIDLAHRVEHEEAFDEVVCSDSVKRILAQPREEMSIVQLMNSDPQIREIFMRPLKAGLQNQDLVVEEVEMEEGEEGEEDSSEMSIEFSSVVGIQEGVGVQ